MTDATAPLGQIFTFYSYKGGTGRSMLLANVAWILASRGQRVLTVDWDLEAPGLHRYFRPFLLDKELTSSDGVIDFVLDFATAAQGPAPDGGEFDADWFVERADISRYAVALDWPFAEPGLLHLVPAGRQDTSYSRRVNTFDWQNFYRRLGGGAFLEATRRAMREQYDYVLIDSRTGVSDTSGISTVQMPDSLVVCFTLNNQSIEGVAAVAASVLQQRDDPPMRMFPVPMRVELAEKRKADLRRAYARDRLGHLPAHLAPAERDRYWTEVEMLYIPFYAYEELLATFGDEPGGTSFSVLNAAERITGFITNNQFESAVPSSPEQRLWVLKQYEVTVASAASLKARLARMPTTSLPEAAPLPDGSRMPLPRNTRFVGRTTELLALAAAFQETQTVAITGIPGIGKTHLASEFVHRFGQFFGGGVFWLNFVDQSNIPSEILACANPGEPELVADFPTLQAAEQLRLILDAWRGDAPRLVVFDACDEVELLNRWRPTPGGARVLVTSRQPLWDADQTVRVVPLNVLPPADSLALLRAGVDDPTLGDPLRVEIADKLGNVPLVLSLASNYLATHFGPHSGAEYLAQLRAAPPMAHESLRADEPSTTPYESNATRWVGVSIARLQPGDRVDLLALELLARAAWFAPAELIPEPLLLQTLVAEAGGLAPEASSQRAFARLAELSLLTAETRQRWRVDRAVADFVRPRTIGTSVRQDVEQVLIARTDELNKQRNPQLLVDLEPHLRAAADGAFWREDASASSLCSVLGFHLAATADFASARRYVERAVRIKEAVFGPDDLGTADSLNDLATVLQAQGAYDEARQQFERALDIYTRKLGPDHSDTARVLSNLGALAERQGDYVEAIARFEEALRVRTDVLGAEDAETASSRDNLGLALRNVGRLGEAEQHLRAALDIRERTLGPDHPDVANSLNNLGLLLFAEGRLPEAESVFQRALVICETRLGVRHADTARALNNIATVLAARGQPAEARGFLQQALDIRLAVLGPNHPLTAATYNNLAHVLLDLGERDLARAYLERALAIYEDSVGPEHADTQRVRATLHELDAGQTATT